MKLLSAWSVRSASKRIATGLTKRLLSNDHGVAAVEFAIVLPLMLLLYLGTAELVNTVLATRKTAIVARAVSDLTSQQVACSDTSILTTAKLPAGSPCLKTSEIADIFNAAIAIFNPYAADVTNLKMTMTHVTLVQDDAASKIYAYVDWTATWGNGAIPRPCQGPAPAATTVSSRASQKPLALADVKPGSLNYQNYFPPSIASSTTALGSNILADVSYAYTPSFGYTYVSAGSRSITNNQMQVTLNRNNGMTIGAIAASASPVTVVTCP